MVRLGRALGRGLAPPPFHGIRFRLGAALAFALLPILALGAFQADAQFRVQDLQRRDDLQLAAERTAASVKGRLDSTTVLLQALRPEALELFCEPRLSALVLRIEGLDDLARLTPTGETVCASQSLG
ncbi:MAG: sensor histidine kinase, partial [Brevundimonas sp.]|nr:sensor histidine kinase [Brevundimonas sp.]